MAGKAAPLTVRKQRHQAALAMLAEGCPFSAAVARIAEDWGCSRRQARNVCHQAMDEIAADWEACDFRHMLANTISRLERLADKAEKCGQFGASVGAIRTLSDLVLTPRLGRSTGAPPHKHHA